MKVSQIQVARRRITSFFRSFGGLAGGMLLLGGLTVCPARAGGIASASSVRFDNPAWSADGKFVAMSGENERGVYLLEVATGACVRVADAAGSGYAFNWSADGKRLGFKLLIPQGDGFPLQQPVVFEVGDKKLTRLCGAVAAAGVPSFSADGKVAYTVDRELRVVGPDGKVSSYSLGGYANLAPISPDGTKVAFNDATDAIRVLDLSSGVQKTLTPKGVGCFGPVWSPDSRRLAVSTTSGVLMSVEVGSGQVWELEEGSSASWLPDSETILYTHADRQFGVALIDSDAYMIRFDGTNRSRVTTDAGGLEASVRVCPDGSRVAYVDLRDGRLYQRATSKSQVTSGYAVSAATLLVPDSVVVQDLASKLGTSTEGLAGQASTGSITLATAVRLSRTCPYVHQVYDTPDAFNGHSACGATSAIMAIEYYQILPTWNVTVSTPYSHVSPYGRYVSEIYSYNGYTYNIGSPDPNDRLGYGGYGYIVRNNWADTRGYMRDYFINHGVSSSVDWSPTWTELKTEINADHPFVLLNSLTTAGHYITTIGYINDDSKRIAIFNDPYGNKNTPGYPSYDGAGSYYDWPGYSNGYKNLNTVHCFIYARAGWPPTITEQPVDRNSARGSVVSFSVTAEGLGPISYRWQKNSSNLTEGGRFSGVNTRVLTITGVEASDVASYRCIVNNTYGSVNSDSAQLSISHPDFDGDGDVDSEDYGHLQICLDLSGMTAPAACGDADLDGDGDVDTSDFARFADCYAGPGRAMAPGCPY